MSGIINKAGLEQWRAIDQAVDGPLRETFRKSFGDDSRVDPMIEQMVQNALDTAPEDPAPNAQPVKRIGLHRV